MTLTKVIVEVPVYTQVDFDFRPAAPVAGRVSIFGEHAGVIVTQAQYGD